MSQHNHKAEHEGHNMCHSCDQCKDCSCCRCEAAQGPALKKMMIIVSKANIDGIYAGLILANGARSEGIECDMFFTFFGLDAITKKRMEHLKVAMNGNPGMHMPEIVGVFPGMESMATHMMMKRMSELDIPPVPEFLDIIKAAGGKVYACKLAMEMFNLKHEDMWDDIDGVLT
ncbi:MAG: DsrE/DsrF/DrsH-like family protein, partial [Candidatus Saccharimonadaceae bacterium]